MVLNHHGVATDLAALRSRHTVAHDRRHAGHADRHCPEGSSWARAVCAWSSMNWPQLRLPAILHWDLNHFVVLKSVGRDQVVVHDPAFGERRLSMEEVSQHFTGVALELWPNPGFAKREEKTRVRLTAADRPGQRFLDHPGPGAAALAGAGGVWPGLALVHAMGAGRCGGLARHPVAHHAGAGLWPADAGATGHQSDPLVVADGDQHLGRPAMESQCVCPHDPPAAVVLSEPPPGRHRLARRTRWTKSRAR